MIPSLDEAVFCLPEVIMKTTFAYDHYYLHDELSRNLEYFSANYPELCQVQVL